MYIHNKIKNHLNNQNASFHMPGHKGREIGGISSADFGPFNAFDITELDETLNIYDYQPFNEQLFKKTASFFGASMSLYSCGGATLAIQAALFTTSAGKSVLCCHDAHIAAENAFILSSIDAVFVDDVNEDIIKKTNPAAVFFTSADYYGRIPLQKLRRISQLCKQNSIPLICDNSHGTHLAFSEHRMLHPLNFGADIVIDSAHKTLPVLTGGALLHLTGSFADNWRSFIRSLKLFATTSPSYLIANSVESGVLFMQHNPEKLIWLLKQCEKVKQALRQKGCTFYEDFGINTDPYRITPIIANAKAVDDNLKAFGVFSEFTNENHIVLIPSVMNNDADFDLLHNFISKSAFIRLEQNKIDKLLYDWQTNKPPKILAVPPRQAAMNKTKLVKTTHCSGFIAAEAVYQYPPAVPIVHAGERIEKAKIPVLSTICDDVLVLD